MTEKPTNKIISGAESVLQIPSFNVDKQELFTQIANMVMEKAQTQGGMPLLVFRIEDGAPIYLHRRSVSYLEGIQSDNTRIVFKNGRYADVSATAPDLAKALWGTWRIVTKDHILARPEGKEKSDED